MNSQGEKNSRIEYLDGWRGLAIIFVLIGHFGGYLVPDLVTMGSFGVEFFFVLSGRLMAEILFVQKLHLPTFFVRRFSRIYPALLFFVATMSAFAAVLWVLKGRSTIEPWMALSALTFTLNYTQVFWQTYASTLSHIWSLSVEEHCYIILALIGAVVARNIPTARLVIGALGVFAIVNGVLLVAGGGSAHYVYWRTDVRLAPVFISAALYLSFGRGTRISPRSEYLLGHLPLPCVALTIALFFLAPIEVHYSASAILLSVAVTTLDYAPVAIRKLLSLRALTWFGALSYSIYLWQQPFYRSQDGSQFWFAMLPAAILAGILSYRFVEQPARNWLNGRFASRRSRIDDASTVSVSAE